MTIKKGDKVTYKAANPRRFSNMSHDRKMLFPGTVGTVRMITGALAVVEFPLGDYAADFVVDLDDLTVEVFTPVDAAPCNGTQAQDWHISVPSLKSPQCKTSSGANTNCHGSWPPPTG